MKPAAASSARIACVLLAAGGSRRLGTPKQLVRRRLQPLLLRALRAAARALPGVPIVVVLGHQALRLRLVVRRAGLGARVVTNSRWADGLATSLGTGLDALPAATRAALVTLVDQPNVSHRSLRRLLAAWRRRPLVPAAAHYAGHAGVPAVIPRSRWRALRALEGDTGARALLRGGAAPTLVAMPEAALDIDTPADLARITKA